ncbi:MAG TPA: hypothetical protein VGN23_06570 [Verrucomicrobiae bacterium]|jgi:hypothetical protein
MKKIILWSIIGFLIAGFAIAGVWWTTRPQVIILKDGTKVTLLGMTYGKHNVPPKIKFNGRSIRGGGAPIDSTNDVGVVWIEEQYKGASWSQFQLAVSDPANTAATTCWGGSYNDVRHGVELIGFRLDAFPRRSGKIILRIISYGSRGQQLAKGQFTVADPAHGSFPQWPTDPLPNTQTDGDLSVTLNSLDANAKSPYNRYNGIPKNDPLNKAVQVDFDVEQNGKPATNWYPIQLIASDATGNNATAWINENNQGNTPTYTFESTLWPNEPAWKLNVEFSRRSGFSQDELWNIPNVPVKPGTQQDAQQFWDYSNQKKPAFAETTINGVHLKVYPAIEYSNGQGNWMPGAANKVVTIDFHTDPDIDSAGMRMTTMEVTDDQGHKLQQWGSGWGSGNYQYSFAVTRAMETMNINVAVHKSRFVEFTVKPMK